MKVSRPVFREVQRRVRSEMNRHHLLPAGSRALIAVSGGQDSLALAELLQNCANSMSRLCTARQSSDLPVPGVMLALAHTDHCWPGDEGCADHVATYAQHAGLLLHIADPGPGSVPQSEAAARTWRYKALAEIAEQHAYTHVAVGHTQSDLAETLLFKLANGAGADGLSSLTWTRALTPSVTLIRPLLSTSRTETGGICEELGVRVWNDVYNRDPRYARFRTREHVLPYLRKYFNPRVESALARTSHLLRDDSAAVEEMASVVYDKVTRLENSEPCTSSIRISRTSLAAEHVAIQRRVLRRALVDTGGVHIRTAVFKQIDALIALLSAPNGASTSSLPSAGQAWVEGSDLVIPWRRETVKKRVPGCVPEHFVAPVRQHVRLPHRAFKRSSENSVNTTRADLSGCTSCTGSGETIVALAFA